MFGNGLADLSSGSAEARSRAHVPVRCAKGMDAELGGTWNLAGAVGA